LNVQSGGIYVVTTKTNWGAVVGVTIAVLAVIFGVIFFFYRRYRANQLSKGSSPAAETGKITNPAQQTSSRSEAVRV